MPDSTLVTAAEAGELVGLSRDAVYNWVRRGYLEPVPDRRRGREKLYRASDVFEVEANVRHEHRRKSAA